MGLAAMALYGLVAYSVKQSRHEICIRMALGAGQADILRQFVTRGLRLTTLGAALGLLASFAVTRWLGSVLYGVSATDAVSYSGAVAIVLGTAIVASVIPAWKGARTSAIAALRHQ